MYRDTINTRQETEIIGYKNHEDHPMLSKVTNVIDKLERFYVITQDIYYF